MSKKGATPINEKAAYTKEQAAELAKTAGDMFSQSSEESKTPTETPKPVLSPEQKVEILTLQRSALMAEQQKRGADQAFEKAMADLNKAYQAVNNHQGYALNEMALEFVSTQA